MVKMTKWELITVVGKNKTMEGFRLRNRVHKVIVMLLVLVAVVALAAPVAGAKGKAGRPPASPRNIYWD